MNDDDEHFHIGRLDASPEAARQFGDLVARTMLREALSGPVGGPVGVDAGSGITPRAGVGHPVAGMFGVLLLAMLAGAGLWLLPLGLVWLAMGHGWLLVVLSVVSIVTSWRLLVALTRKRGPL